MKEVVEALLSGGAVAAIGWGLAVLFAAFLFWLGVRVGVPAAKIASLERHVEKLQWDLKEANDRALVAQSEAHELREDLNKAVTALNEAREQIKTLVAAIQIKTKLDLLADRLQPLEK